MRSAIIVPRVPWRGLAAFALDNLIPLLGFTAFTVGAFHLPGLWGTVGGFCVVGASLIKIHDLLQGPELDALKQEARNERIERRQQRQRDALDARRLKAA